MKRLIGAAAVGLALAWAAHANPAKPRQTTVKIKTSDGWQLAATMVAAPKPDAEKTAVVLLHGLAAGKSEWTGLQAALAVKGVSSLAVDLRGHGGSTRKGRAKIEFQQFADHGPDGEWMNLWKDGQAGFEFLQSKGYKRIGLAGASVGANAAAVAASKIPEAHFLLLLSAGMDYQGIQPADALQAYGPRHLLLAASQADGYAFNSAAFFRNIRYTARLPADWAQTARGHGVQMFEDPQMTDRVVSWILEKN